MSTNLAGLGTVPGMWVLCQGIHSVGTRVARYCSRTGKLRMGKIALGQYISFIPDEIVGGELTILREIGFGVVK